MSARRRPRPLTTRPTVSVVVPCYNYGHFLPQCLRSVTSQPGVDLDVVIVDDASTDSSLAVAESLAHQDSRITILHHEQNAGHIATYNDGVRASTGDYVVLLSADDLLTPGSLARSLAVLEQDRDIAFVYGFAQMFQDQPPSSRQSPTSWTVWSGHEWVSRSCRRGSGTIVNPEVVMRRDVFEAAGGYDPRLPHAADMLLWLKAAVRGRVARINGADQALYRVHGANMHLTDQAGFLTDLRERGRVFATLFAEDAAGWVDRDELLVRAQRSLAVEAIRLACYEYDTRTEDDLSAYTSFALEQWADIAASRWWNAYARRASGRMTEGERALAMLEWRARHIVRWRRWRRVGI